MIPSGDTFTCMFTVVPRVATYSYVGCTLYNPGTPFMLKGPSIHGSLSLCSGHVYSTNWSNQAVGQELHRSIEADLWVIPMSQIHGFKELTLSKDSRCSSQRTSVIPITARKEEGSVFLIPLGSFQSTEWLTSHVTSFWFLCMLPNYTQFLKVLSLLCFSPRTFLTEHLSATAGQAWD